MRILSTNGRFESRREERKTEWKLFAMRITCISFGLIYSLVTMHPIFKWVLLLFVCLLVRRLSEMDVSVYELQNKWNRYRIFFFLLSNCSLALLINRKSFLHCIHFLVRLCLIYNAPAFALQNALHIVLHVFQIDFNFLSSILGLTCTSTIRQCMERYRWILWRSMQIKTQCHKLW